MSIESFYTDMIIDTERGIENFIKAFEDAENHVPCALDDIEAPMIIWDQKEIARMFGDDSLAACTSEKDY